MNNIDRYLGTENFQKYWKRLSNHNWKWMVADTDSVYKKGKLLEYQLEGASKLSNNPLFAQAFKYWESKRDSLISSRSKVCVDIEDFVNHLLKKEDDKDSGE